MDEERYLQLAVLAYQIFVTCKYSKVAGNILFLCIGIYFKLTVDLKKVKLIYSQSMESRHS